MEGLKIVCKDTCDLFCWLVCIIKYICYLVQSCQISPDFLNIARVRYYLIIGESDCIAIVMSHVVETVR